MGVAQEPAIGARRGDKLREHILEIAKDVFLETGFERASMDTIASRAGTSKRSLYAHFESKEKLFLAVADRVRGLFTNNLKLPSHYSANSEEALVLYCARYLEILLYDRSVQMCRVSIAEVSQFPEGAAQYCDVLFTQVQIAVSAYLKKTYGLTAKASGEATDKLLGQVLYPQFQRALFGTERLNATLSTESRLPDALVKKVRKAVGDLLAHLGRID